MTFSLQATATALEQKIRANRLFTTSASWHDELVFPYYNGLSLRNIPHTAASLLGAPLPDSVPLVDDVWGGAAPTGDIDRVMVFLLDGLGYLYLQQLIETDDVIRQLVIDLTGGRGMVPLTSVAPSSTAIALTSLWTGAAPAEHGIVGTSMFMRELSMLGDMIMFRPVMGKHLPESFDTWGLAPETIVQKSGFAEHLTAHGIPSIMIQDKVLMGSGLSRILHRGIQQTAVHASYDDVPWRIAQTLRETRGQRCYIASYWPAIDSLSHLYGAHTEPVRREILHTLTVLRDVLQDERTHDGRTLVIITADHGEYDAPNAIDMLEHEDAGQIRDALTIGVAGDQRLAALYVLSNRVPQVKAAFDEHFADCLTYIDADEALAAGLYGPNPAAVTTHTRRRLGDLIIIPRQSYRVFDRTAGNYPLVSWHGGLSEWEMLTPLMWQQI